MNNDYWHKKWQSNEIGFNQLQPNTLMQRYFSSLNLPTNCRVFVPLCGQSIDMLWLTGQGFKVIGIELSQVACNAFFKENNIPVNITEINDFMCYHSDNITIFCGDFFKLDTAILGKIDAVYDRAALVALPKDTRKAYAEYLIEMTKQASAMFIITTLYHQNEMQGPPFSVNEDEVITLYGAHFYINQVYSKPFKIPAHLQAKGLLKATEQAYLLTKIAY